MWEVVFEPTFDKEFGVLPADVQDRLLAKIGLLARFGPQLGRPHVDHLKASAFPNMKELRIPHDRQVWRLAFAFDPRRRAILLVAGDKQGVDERRFYRELIDKADRRFAAYQAL